MKFSFELPHNYLLDGHKTIEIAVSHFLSMVQQSAPLRESCITKEAYIQFVSNIIGAQMLSLREVESLVRHLEIYQLLTENSGLNQKTTLGYGLLRVWGVAIFSFQKEFARSLARGYADAKTLGSLFGEDGPIKLTDGGYPREHHQVLLTVISDDCNFNSDFYFPGEEYSARWNESFNSLFQYNPFPPEKGQRLKIITEVLDIMTFRKG